MSRSLHFLSYKQSSRTSFLDFLFFLTFVVLGMYVVLFFFRRRVVPPRTSIGAFGHYSLRRKLKTKTKNGHFTLFFVFSLSLSLSGVEREKRLYRFLFGFNKASMLLCLPLFGGSCKKKEEGAPLIFMTSIGSFFLFPPLGRFAPRLIWMLLLLWFLLGATCSSDGLIYLLIYKAASPPPKKKKKMRSIFYKKRADDESRNITVEERRVGQGAV